jgi:hypothetical protein
MNNINNLNRAFGCAEKQGFIFEGGREEGRKGGREGRREGGREGGREREIEKEREREAGFSFGEREREKKNPCFVWERERQTENKARRSGFEIRFRVQVSGFRFLGLGFSV